MPLIFNRLQGRTDVHPLPLPSPIKGEGFSDFLFRGGKVIGYPQLSSPRVGEDEGEGAKWIPKI
jgi:hypothetical protein